MNKSPIEQTFEFWMEFARKQMEFQNESFKEVVKFNQNIIKQLPDMFKPSAYATSSSRRNSVSE